MTTHCDTAAKRERERECVSFFNRNFHKLPAYIYTPVPNFFYLHFGIWDVG